MKKNLAIAGAAALLFLLLILLVCKVDVAAIGPEDTSIGLSRINQAVSQGIGVHLTWYKITKYLGYLAYLAAGGFALLGLVQLVRRKSVKKVDRELLALGGLYLLGAVLYIVFEKVVINYRPVILAKDGGQPQPSFPSTHTMLACVIWGSAFMLAGKYLKTPALRTVARLLCALLLAVTVAGRLYSGVHWLTDILGGILVSTALLALFAAVKDDPKKGWKHTTKA